MGENFSNTGPDAPQVPAKTPGLAAFNERPSLGKMARATEETEALIYDK